ncbi:HutD family protein [Arthrobacter sp. ES3-54]|uniref:HutD/Ves family protein n=1 Tax=Arthrobacter sp. ES3-54 TaxID=1502991 RepID=UPI002405BB91|nr:HutD family protein [Arthrobacter sp. ES3-54]MDF9751956.1 environmental stress-induced protein Ves [Arthrobacter sp. ES3-54]
MEIIRYAELKAHPWRNGGGVTREVARHPRTPSVQTAMQNTAQDNSWDWRISIAEVSKAGPFSAFAGMDRVLTVIDGELLLLSVDGAEHPLEKYRPFRFSGDAAAAGALPTGDIRDLNVITRNGAFKGYTSIIELSKKRAHPVFGGQFGILLQGQGTVSPGTAGDPAPDAGSPVGPPTVTSESEPERVELNRYDAVVGADTAAPEIVGRGFLAVVSIDPAEPGTD